MGQALQILHQTMVEPRLPSPTIKFVDDYCKWYQKLFPEVRSFEAFKYLHVGMIRTLNVNHYPQLQKLQG
jgi:SRSO17 transposase